MFPIVARHLLTQVKALYRIRLQVKLGHCCQVRLADALHDFLRYGLLHQIPPESFELKVLGVEPSNGSPVCQASALLSRYGPSGNLTSWV